MIGVHGADDLHEVRESVAEDGAADLVAAGAGVDGFVEQIPAADPGIRDVVRGDALPDVRGQGEVQHHAPKTLAVLVLMVPP